MLHNNLKNHQKGFTLLELIIGMVIVTIGLTTALPSYIRNMRQGNVDRYTQQLEAGFFGLRAKLGQQKTSCTLRFDTSGLSVFVAPSELIEVNKKPSRLECCNSEIRTAGKTSGCEYGPKIGALMAQSVDDPEQKSKAIRYRSLRLMDSEGTSESKQVQVAVNSTMFELTPPGTSTMANDLIFLIRSIHNEDQQLRVRCLQISATGTIFRGSWNQPKSSCEK